MVIQKTVDNLKDRPKDERQAVAIGTAGVVVLLLLVGWAFYFLKSIRTEQSVSAQQYDVPDLSTPTYQDNAPANSYQGTDQFGVPNTSE